jgi:hypothetical protein
MGSSDRKTKKKSKGQKQLGKAALRAILKNEGVAEEFLQALRAGQRPETMMLAKVIRPLGGAQFIVNVEGMEVRAGLSGILTGRGGFFRNPEASTAVRADAYVVVEDIGLGPYAAGTTHQIVAVLDAGQAAEARKLLRAWSASSESSLGSGFTFNSSNLIERAGEIRGAQIANVARTMAGLRPGGAAAAAAVAKTASEEAAAAANVAQEAAAAAATYAVSSSESSGTRRRRKHTARSKKRKLAKKAAAGGGGGGKA